MNKYAHWFIKFVLMFVLCHIIARMVSPFACMFIKREPRLDTVKRLGKKKVLIGRDSLVWWLTWFDTDWVVEKLSEYSLLGIDTAPYLIKYADILTKRQEARDAIV